MKKWFVLLMLLITIGSFDAAAQGCSICTNTASQLGEKPATGLNMGILYLATIPLTVLGGLGFYWYRHLRSN